MPDAKTMGRWGMALGPATIKPIHERMVQIAHDNGVAPGRRMRVDTTIVETNIHDPTGTSGLAGRVHFRTSSAIASCRGSCSTRSGIRMRRH
jgi:transposase, IS5 family